MRILLVEDDRDVAGYVGRGLEEEGYQVTGCFDGAAALSLGQSSRFDIIILDVMLPFLNGLEVTRRLRLAGVDTPILLLTARDAAQDIVYGLDAGADDYLTKPFSFGVLLARVRARTRTPPIEARSRLRFHDLALDLDSHQAFRGEHKISLTRTEFAILECLLKSAGRVVPRQRLIDTVWGAERGARNNNLDVFIRSVRGKVDSSGLPRLIHTVRGIGYSLRDES